MAGSSLTESSMADMDTSDAGEAAAIPSPADFAAPARLRRRRWHTVLVVVLVVIVVAVVILGRWSVGYYALTPGDATPVASFIKVPAHLDHRLTGTILFTDVYETQLNALTYLQERYFSSVAQVLPAGEVTGSAPANQYIDQGYLQMSQAQQYATAAALTYLGYTVRQKNAGALIIEIPAGSPAANVLKVSEVITAVNGTPTSTPCALVNALHGLVAGTRATLSVETSSISANGAFVTGPTVHRAITLGTPPKGLVDTGCGPSTKPTAYLGIVPAQQLSWDFPVKVSVADSRRGGAVRRARHDAGHYRQAVRWRSHREAHGGGDGHHRSRGRRGGRGRRGAEDDRGRACRGHGLLRAAGGICGRHVQGHAAAARVRVSSLDQTLRILKSLGGTVPAHHVSAQAAP